MDQELFLVPMRRLGYDATDEGMCAGYGTMAAQAIFAGQFKQFEERLKTMRGEPVDQLVKSIQNIPYPNPPEDINAKPEEIAQRKKAHQEKMQKYVDMRAFFDGITLYQHGVDHPELYPVGNAPREQDSIEPTAEIISPVSFNKNDDHDVMRMKRPDIFSGVYDKDELVKYLQSLEKTMAAMPPDERPIPLVMEVKSLGHFTALSYDPNNLENPWTFIDANANDEQNTHFSSVDKLAEKMMQAYPGEESGQVLLSTGTLSVTTRGEKYEGSYDARVQSFLSEWKKSPEWINLHAVTDEKLNYRNSSGFSWFNLEMSHLFEHAPDIKKIDAFLAKSPASAREEVMVAALEGGHQELIQHLMNKGVDFQYKDEHGKNFLFAAVKCQDQKVAKENMELLINRGVDVNELNNAGFSVLFNCAAYGDNEKMNFLIQHGADINQKDNNNGSLLFTAAMNGHEHTIDELVKRGLDINAKNSLGETPLFAAAENGKLAVVKQLTQMGASDLDQKNKEGKTPLLMAAANHRVDVAQFLVEQGADVNAKDKKGYSVLFYALSGATSREDLSLVNFLIEKGANVNDMFSPAEMEKERVKFTGDEAWREKQAYVLSLAMESNNVDATKALISTGLVAINPKHIESCKTEEMKQLLTAQYLKNEFNLPANLTDIAVKALAVFEHIEKEIEKMPNKEALLTGLNRDKHALMRSLKDIESVDNIPSQAQIIIASKKLNSYADFLEKQPSCSDESISQLSDKMNDFFEEIDKVKNEKAQYSAEEVKAALSSAIQALYADYNAIEMLSSQPGRDQQIFNIMDQIGTEGSMLLIYMEDCLAHHADDMNEFMENLWDADPSIPLMIYAVTGDENFKDALCMDVNDLCAVTRNNGTPFEVYPIHLAIMMNNKDAVSSLIENGADVNQVSHTLKTKQGQPMTPVAQAIIKDDMDMLKMLIKGGANVTRGDLALCSSEKAKEIIMPRYVKGALNLSAGEEAIVYKMSLFIEKFKNVQSKYALFSDVYDSSDLINNPGKFMENVKYTPSEGTSINSHFTEKYNELFNLYDQLERVAQEDSSLEMINNTPEAPFDMLKEELKGIKKMLSGLKEEELNQDDKEENTVHVRMGISPN